jgi:hypothetical protein
MRSGIISRPHLAPRASVDQTMVGTLVGGIVGTALPVPIVGTMIGACLGAFVGLLIGDLWAGRPLFPSVEAGWGAAVGRFWGTVSKLAIGGIIVVILTLSAFFCWEGTEGSAPTGPHHSHALARVDACRETSGAPWVLAPGLP